MSERSPTGAQLEAAGHAWDKYGLNDRADVPQNGAALLIKEAAESLDEVWRTIFEQNAVTEQILLLAREAAEKAQDASLIAAIEPKTVPTVGIVGQLADGAYR